jgi:prevent-host-death family protein
MPQFTIRVAKMQLSKLVDAALAGEDVVIVKDNKPAVRLVAISQGKFRIGLLKGQLIGPGPDFLECMGDDELKSWDAGF